MSVKNGLAAKVELPAELSKLLKMDDVIESSKDVIESSKELLRKLKK